MEKKWKYADNICIGCKIREESGEEILQCDILNIENRRAEFPVKYSDLYSKSIGDIVKVGKLLENGLKRRDQVIEMGIT